jgi:hypothetical protein
LSTSTATAYKYSVAGHLSFGAPKCEKAQKSSGFWADRTYWLCIKDNVLIDPACGSGSLLLKAEKVLGRDAVRNGFYGQEINITTYNLCRKTIKSVLVLIIK